MADLTSIREGLAANLSALKDVQVSPYMLANPQPPSAHVFPADISYDQAMVRGVDQWTFTVQAFVGLIDAKGAQVKLDALLAPSGSQSVKQLLEVDRTLAGVVADLHVTGCSGYRVYPRDPNPPVLGAEWTVSVLATGT